MSGDARTDQATTRPSGGLTPRRILVGAALVVGVVWLAVFALWPDAPFAVTFDDAWYYFEIGRNIADGHGSTFDTINQTNGYHPLWMGASVATYAAGLDGMTAVRTLLAFQLACWVGALVLVARVATSEPLAAKLADRPDAAQIARRAAWTAAAVLIVLAVNPYVIKATVNGLESGFVVLTQAAVLAVVWSNQGRVLAASNRSRWVLSGLLALAFLARTDGLLLIACLGLWTLAETPTAERGHRLVPLVQTFTVPAVVIVGYLAWSAATFGDPRQVSGETKRLALTGGSLLTLLVIAAIALALARRGFGRVARDQRSRRLARTALFLDRTSWYLAFLLLLVGYYAELSAQQWLWYYAPIALYLVALAVMLALDFCEASVLEAPEGRTPARAMAPLQAILIGVLGVMCILGTRTFADPAQRSILLANRDAGRWISANLPDDTALASWDAGVVGYFADQPVVNLDGVVNSFDWLDARRAGTTEEFLRADGVRYTVNHAALGPDGEDPGIRADITRVFDQETSDRSELVHREEFTYHGGIEGADAVGDQWAVFVYDLDPQ